jgi:peptidoglycan/LPS O-acetylase OafA/YrhL
LNNPESEKLQTVYFPNLDASRFLAAFAVFILHFSNEIRSIYPSINEASWFKGFYLFASKGGLGVNFFFVLSGFLITFLILNERKRFGQFHLGRFLIRRTLRIWPLYFIIGLIGFVLFPLIFADYSTLHQPQNYFLFLANFDEIWYGAHDPINFLTAPWSVAVEEQFYLFWGLALLILFRFQQRFLPWLILLLYLISFWFRFNNWENERVLYHHTLSVCQDILTGAFIGYALFQQQKWIGRLQQTPRWLVFSIYLVGLLLCIGKNKIFLGEMMVMERWILSLFFGFIILDQIGGKHSLFKLGRIKLFNYFGKISYGLYMYHLVIMYLLGKWIDFSSLNAYLGIFLYFILSFGMTVFSASVSFHSIESKFLSLKPKHRRK